MFTVHVINIFMLFLYSYKYNDHIYKQTFSFFLLKKIEIGPVIRKV